MTQYRYTIIFTNCKIISDDGWISFDAMWNTILDQINENPDFIVQDVIVSRYVRS